VINIILTHDVDSIRKPFKHIWQRRRRFRIWDLLLTATGIKNLYNNIEEIVRLEDAYNFRSVFFIPVFLFNVEEIIDILRSIRKNKWEVQLHYVYEPNQYLGLFRMQKEFFEKEIGRVEGVRVHKLIINDAILDMFQKEGIKYDTTFRVETTGTYDPFLVRKGLLEIPIAVMDADLFGRLRLSEQQALKYILWKIRQAEQKGAKYFTILFHQESFMMKGGRIYREILKHISSKGYEVKLPKDIINFKVIENENEDINNCFMVFSNTT